jgi:hypothetical protein
MENKVNHPGPVGQEKQNKLPFAFILLMIMIPLCVIIMILGLTGIFSFF